MRLLLILLVLATHLGAEPKRLELGFPHLADRIQIVFPENYDQARSWPAVFYYHGTGGKPDTSLIQAHTGNRDFFVVGMAYVQPGSFSYSEKSLDDEWRVLQATRNHLATKWNLDRKRVYVAGFSKGGWMSGFMLQKDPALAGAVILGAGHIHNIHKSPRKFRQRKSLFLGVGRQDGNYPFTLRALVFYRPLNVQTTIETWHDLGHRFPTDGSPALRQWLALEAHPKADHAPAAREWLDGRIDQIKTLPNPVDQWVAFRDLEGTPYLRVLGETAKSDLETRIAKLETGGRVAAEATALTEHRTLLRKEMGVHTDQLYQGLLNAYLKLSQDHPGTRQGEIALGDYQRVKRLLQHFKEQEKIAKQKKDQEVDPKPAPDPFPKPPTNRPVIPRNPLIK